MGGIAREPVGDVDHRVRAGSGQRRSRREARARLQLAFAQRRGDLVRELDGRIGMLQQEQPGGRPAQRDR